MCGLLLIIFIFLFIAFIIDVIYFIIAFYLEYLIKKENFDKEKFIKKFKNVVILFFVVSIIYLYTSYSGCGYIV